MIKACLSLVAGAKSAQHRDRHTQQSNNHCRIPPRHKVNQRGKDDRIKRAVKKKKKKIDSTSPTEHSNGANEAHNGR